MKTRIGCLVLLAGVMGIAVEAVAASLGKVPVLMASTVTATRDRGGDVVMQDLTPVADSRPAAGRSGRYGSYPRASR